MSRSQGWFPWQAAQRINTPKQDVPEGFAPERALAALRFLHVAPPRDASHALPAPFLAQTHLTDIQEYEFYSLSCTLRGGLVKLVPALLHCATARDNAGLLDDRAEQSSLFIRRPVAPAIQPDAR